LRVCGASQQADTADQHGCRPADLGLVKHEEPPTICVESTSAARGIGLAAWGWPVGPGRHVQVTRPQFAQRACNHFGHEGSGRSLGESDRGHPPDALFVGLQQRPPHKAKRGGHPPLLLYCRGAAAAAQEPGQNS
jgi:hypothetical protein